jgi:hypothetical protein
MSSVEPGTDEVWPQEIIDRLSASQHVVAYLGKLYAERAGAEESITVRVSVRKKDASTFVIAVDGHEVEFSAG